MELEKSHAFSFFVLFFISDLKDSVLLRHNSPKSWPKDTACAEQKSEADQALQPIPTGRTSLLGMDGKIGVM